MNHRKNTHYIRWLPALCFILFLGNACTHIKPVPLSEGSNSYTLNCPWKQMTPDDTPGPSYNVTGKASWYGKRFHRRRTASGERFNMHAHTAAHRTLPFGTRLLVTSISSGKSVVVRVNDRGPHSRRLVIDLSYAAAKKIGIRGSMDVQIERLSGPSVAGKKHSDEDDMDVYMLQAGSFESREKAESLLTKLSTAYGPVNLVSEKGLYKVRVGTFEDPDHAKLMKEDLRNKGYQVFTVKQTPDAVALAEFKAIQPQDRQHE